MSSHECFIIIMFPVTFIDVWNKTKYCIYKSIYTAFTLLEMFSFPCCDGTLDLEVHICKYEHTGLYLDFIIQVHSFRSHSFLSKHIISQQGQSCSRIVINAQGRIFDCPGVGG